MELPYQNQTKTAEPQVTALGFGMAGTGIVSVERLPVFNFRYLISIFCDYAAYDLGLSLETVAKYKESLNWFLRYLPHLDYPQKITAMDITAVKKYMAEKKLSGYRVNGIIFALKKFLAYCNEVHKVLTINPKEIKAMRIKKREVIFLTKEEINQLFNSISTYDNKYGTRARALMELLLATGMRISEALGLNRDSINWETREAVIIGKGDKQRTIFLTERAMGWLKKYLDTRQDANPALFVVFGSEKRLARHDLSKEFRRYAENAGIKKKVTPHILRHTMATLMLHNGANIMDIKDLLGHSDIKTTAQYYLGTDKRALKAAHDKFLDFN